MAQPGPDQDIAPFRLLRRNPARGLVLPAQALLAPRQLSPDQRYVLRSLVERAGDDRAEAIFALGYWAGCRVSDVSWLRVDHAHIGPKIGWAHVGHKGDKERDIDLVNAARRPLYAYIQRGGRDPESPFVFTSQRAPGSPRPASPIGGVSCGRRPPRTSGSWSAT